jgi:hypothetical protein
MKIPRSFGRIALTLTAVALVLWLAGALAPAQDQPQKNTKFPQTVLVIRHGEKSGDKEDIHLTKKGQQRADALYKLFEASSDRPEPFPRPDFIISAGPHKDSVRPLETVTPLSKKLNLPINSKYESKILPKTDDKEKSAKPDMYALRDELFGDKKYSGKTVLICWRHSTISELAKTLKASNVPEKWDDEVFDRVFQINYDNEGTATFINRPQRLLAGDSDK